MIDVIVRSKDGVLRTGCRIGTALLFAGLSMLVAPAAAAAPGEPSAARAVWLGVWSGDAVDGGAQILAVVPNGPAEQGGLREGDVVVEFGGSSVAGEADLGRALRGLAPGDSARLAVLREGQRLELVVRVGEKGDREPFLLAPPLPPVPPVATPPAPEAPPAPATEAWRVFGIGLAPAGLTVAEIGPALRAHYGAPADAGVLVTRVEDGTAAATAGLVVGDVLVRIADSPIRSEREVRGNLVRWNTGEPLRIEVVRSGEPQVLTLAPVRAAARRSRDANRATERLLEADIERLKQRLAQLEQELERLRSKD
jgi:C-terminal processing protease CtpA/Prc